MPPRIFEKYFGCENSCGRIALGVSQMFPLYEPLISLYFTTSWYFCYRLSTHITVQCCISTSAGLLDLTIALNLSQYLRKEKEYVPWDAGLAWLYTLEGRLAFTSVYGKFQVTCVWQCCVAFVWSLVLPFFFCCTAICGSTVGRNSIWAQLQIYRTWPHSNVLMFFCIGNQCAWNRM